MFVLDRTCLYDAYNGHTSALWPVFTRGCGLCYWRIHLHGLEAQQLVVGKNQVSVWCPFHGAETEPQVTSLPGPLHYVRAKQSFKGLK